MISIEATGTMETTSLTLRIIPMDSLVTAIAFGLLALAMFLFAKRGTSRVAYISSALLAYCAMTLIAKFMLFFAVRTPAYHAFDAVTSTWGFYFLLNGARPYALVIAACCAIVVARRSPITGVRGGDVDLPYAAAGGSSGQGA